MATMSNVDKLRLIPYKFGKGKNYSNSVFVGVFHMAEALAINRNRFRDSSKDPSIIESSSEPGYWRSSRLLGESTLPFAT